MRPSGDVYGASPRRYKTEELNDPASPMRNDSNRRSGSHRSSRNNEDYDSESSSSSSSKKTTRSNQDHQQAEVLRKLESLKGHLLRTNPKDSDQPPPPPAMGFHGGGHHVPPYYNNPYPEPYPYGMYPPQSHVPPPYGFTRPPQGWYHGAHHPPYPQGQYVDIGSDIIDPHDHRFFPTPSRYGDVPFSPVRNQGDKLGPFSPLSVVQGHHHTRWPSEIESDIVGVGGAFARGYVQKDVSDNDSRRCHPLVGGAPFIACHNCFELLYLPKKKLLAQEKQQKLECGACSEVISFAFVDKKLVFSIAETHTNPLPVEAQVRTTVVDDCPLKDQEPRLSEHSDDEDRSSVSSESQKQVIKSVRRKVKATKVPPPPPEKSNLLELFEYSNVNRAALTYGMEQLGYNKQRQDSVKPESVVATETDVSYNNTEVSEDSRISKASEYSFSEVTDKAISNDENMEQLEVWVNGHLIPEDLVISAEKLAGPVQAGKYWYDYRAGFWGVMGSPCLGIIPPFIEEFSRPMPDNCGAGNTGVFVNGRELHERDFELLARRGLPRGKNRSYIIDISGRVLDGDSGEELNCLGKLAPTIEKVKHGFGMRVPRSLLVSS